ncbi:MAG: D-alanine--D-alanine ligase, partial [uncultured Acetobacteraceae bacterium]
DQARRGPLRRHLGRARGEPRLRQAVHRGAARGRLPGGADRRGRRPRRAHNGAPRSASGRGVQHPARPLRRGRLHPGRAGLARPALHRLRPARLRPRHGQARGQGHVRRRGAACRAAPPGHARRAGGRRSAPPALRAEAAERGLLRRRQHHPRRRQPAGADRARLDLGHPRDGRTLRGRPRDHRGGDGRPAARRDGDRHPPGLLRLRGEVRGRRQRPHPPGADPPGRRGGGDADRRGGAPGARLPRHLPRRFPLRRHGGRAGAARAPGGQHPARHDPHQPGAGAGRALRHRLPRPLRLDGGAGPPWRV